MGLLTPSSPGGLPTLSLTTNSCWGRAAMPLISLLMLVPHVYAQLIVKKLQCATFLPNSVIIS